MRGAFIVLEGIDNAGKTAACAAIKKEMGDEVEVIRFPTREGILGAAIGPYMHGEGPLNHEAAHLLLAADRWRQEDHIVALLKAGTTVICDRHSDSAVAYTRALSNQNLSLDWCFSTEVGLTDPDYVIFMDVTPSNAAERYGRAEPYEEAVQFQSRLLEAYSELKQDHWIHVDANQPLDTVAARVIDLCVRIIEKVRIVEAYAELGRLNRDYREQ